MFEKLLTGNSILCLAALFNDFVQVEIDAVAPKKFVICVSQALYERNHSPAKGVITQRVRIEQLEPENVHVLWRKYKRLNKIKKITLFG
jgi:hypothetical protein